VSSARKDARWQLAWDKVEAAGMQWEDLQPWQYELVLTKAEIDLAAHPERIEELAARWNSREG
jgi:hypothetical protein